MGKRRRKSTSGFGRPVRGPGVSHKCGMKNIRVTKVKPNALTRRREAFVRKWLQEECPQYFRPYRQRIARRKPGEASRQVEKVRRDLFLQAWKLAEERITEVTTNEN